MIWPRQLPSRAHGAGLAALVLSISLAPFSANLAAVPLAFFVAACAMAPFFPGWAFFVPARTHGARSRPEVAITFDDGPDPRTLHPLLDLLGREGVPATFFLVGCRAAAHPQLVRDILEKGHQVGNHSQTHDPLMMLRSVNRLRREVATCQDVLASLGATPLVFRPPVGITNPRLLGVLRSLGLTCVTFSCRPLDFGSRRMRGLRERVLGRIRPGDVLLLHDRLPPAVAVSTWLDEVSAILAGLKAKGLRVVPLPHLLGMAVMRTGVPVLEVPAGAAPAQPAPGEAEKGGGVVPRVLSLAPAIARVLFAIAYPLLVTFGVALLGTRTTAVLLLTLLVAGQVRSRPGLPFLGPLRRSWVGVAVLLGVAALLGDTRYMLWYPSLVNLALLLQFAWSLRMGPPMIERFARMAVRDLSVEEVRYCRNVTMAWCAFFLLNGATATALALWAPRTWWAAFTGGISYVLVGAVFAGELLVRRKRFGRHVGEPIDRQLARWLRAAVTVPP